MSFEIIVRVFDNEQLRPIPRSAVRERFEPHIAREDDFGWWTLEFAEGACAAEVSPGRKSSTAGFVVHRPPDFLTFWLIIAGFLRDYPCVLFWPGGGAVMESLDLLPHLPKSFIEAMGIPWVSTDPKRIRQYVRDHS